jgi:SAM-dependent methyltransferase
VINVLSSEIETACDDPSWNSTTTGSLALEEVACNVCGSQSSKVLFQERYCLANDEVDLSIRRCRECGLSYTSPRLTRESIRQVYEQDSEQTISHNYCWGGDKDAIRFASLIRHLTTKSPSGRLLDIGCGVGQFIAEVERASDWETIGLEPSEQAAEEARRHSGANVITATLEEADLDPGSFDAVSLLGVLEHLHDPRATLDRVRSLLRPDGMLLTYVPNFNYLRVKDTGAVAYLRHGRWSALHPQEHLFHFTPSSFRSLLTASGFSCIRLEIGRPFTNGGFAGRLTKELAYNSARLLHATTGLHLAGIEAVSCLTTSKE